MKVLTTAIEGVVILEPEVFGDARGYFFESYSQRKFDEQVRSVRFVQDNESHSRYGVLRGLHFQKGRYAQSKLVRVVRGRVLDVAVDIRRGSPTFGRHVSVELSGDNKRQFFIPRGFAHGFGPAHEGDHGPVGGLARIHVQQADAFNGFRRGAKPDDFGAGKATTPAPPAPAPEKKK